MSARLVSFFIWALAAATAVFWGLKIWAQPLPVPAHAALVVTSPALQGDLTRLLGADPVVSEPDEAAPVADLRLTLVGVVSPRGNSHQREGLALISIDGQPPKTYRVGAVVDGERVLQAVGQRTASLGPRGGAVQVSLSIPAPAEAARGLPGGIKPIGGLPGAPSAATQNPAWAQQPPPADPPPGVDAPVPGQDRATLR